MSEAVYIDKEAAAAALRRGAFLIDDLDSEDYGRRLIHCFRGSIGCDWNLDEAIALVAKCERVGWVKHWADHDLGVLADGKVYRFDIEMPEAEQ